MDGSNADVQHFFTQRFKLDEKSSSLLKYDHSVSSNQRPTSTMPTCSLCMRRLKTLKHLLSLHHSFSDGVGDQEIAVGRSFHCSTVILEKQSPKATANDIPVLDVRCIVCFTYDYYQKKDPSSSSTLALSRSSTTSTTSSSSLLLLSPSRKHASSNQPKNMFSSILGSCYECHLLENIWSCLICGYTGCGRYTGQHAQKHCLESFHQYSLELATGRIWEYCNDRFVHYEDSSSVYNGLLQQFTNLRFETTSDSFQPLPLAPIENPNGNSPDRTTVQSTTTSSYSTPAPVIPPTKPTKSLYSTPPPHFQRDPFSTTSSSSSAAAGNPLSSASKLLVSDSFLQQQDDQLLQSLDVDKVEKISNLTKEYEKMIEFQLHDQQLYYEKLLARETVRAMEYSFNLQRGGGPSSSNQPSWGGRPSSNDEFNPFSNGIISSAEDNLILDKELEEIEKLKMDISSLEMEARTLLEHKKDGEEKLRMQKKVNDQILKEQKFYVRRIVNFLFCSADLF
jgi:hypothetical protein